MGFRHAVSGLLLLLLKLSLSADVAIIFLRGLAQKLERHDKQDDADAGAGEHAARSDVP